jgi:DNA-binding FadR family transcriptional regulator
MPNLPDRRKLYEFVVDEIGKQIIAGSYAPGQTLPNEDALCRQFQVSRGVLREATKVLINKGLICSRPKIGTQVRDPRDWNLFDEDVLIWKLKTTDRHAFLRHITEVRRIIETEALALAAARASDPEIEDIMTLYQALTASLDDKKTYLYANYLRADMQFHTAILEASHNELLAQIARTMRQAVITGRQLDTQDITILRDSLPHHRAMVDALTARNETRARQAALQMFAQVMRHLPGTDGGS